MTFSLTIFNSLYLKEKEFFEKYKPILSVIKCQENKELDHIFSTNIKIIYDRHNNAEKTYAYNLMKELLNSGKVKFVTDTLYTTKKSGNGESIKVSLPKDRIIMSFHCE